MIWFSKGKGPPGWFSIGFTPQQIDVAHLQTNGSGRPEVLLCESYKIEGSLAESLVQLRKSLKLDYAHCVTLLGPADYQLLHVEAPNVPAAELKAAASWRIKGLIDYPVERATIEVLTIPVGSGANRAASVFAIAAPDDTIRQRVQLFEEAGIPLEIIDVAETSQRNIAALVETEGSALAMFCIDARVGLLTINFGGELLFARNLDASATELVDAPAERRVQLIGRIANELQRSFDHFDRQFNGTAVAKLLVGALPVEVGLHEYLTSNLSVPAETLSLEGVLDMARVPDLKNPQRQAQCVKLLGAALRGAARQ